MDFLRLMNIKGIDLEFNYIQENGSENNLGTNDLRELKCTNIEFDNQHEESLYCCWN